jgi:small subunit ribosomal protein S16
MIKLRLKRFGKKREASFRLVAVNSTSRRDGRPLEELGYYNPRTKETRLDTEAIRARLEQGAQPSDTVLTLLERGGLVAKGVRPSVVVGQKKQAIAREAAAKQAAKDAAAAKAAAAAEAKAAAEAVAEAPTEEPAEA